MDFPQIIANSLVRAAELSLLAIGLTMVYDILKFANFAHADYAILGGFLVYTFNQGIGLNLFLSVLLAAVATGVISLAIDRAVFKPLRKRESKPVTLMITSLGMRSRRYYLRGGRLYPDPRERRALSGQYY